ncbi:synaptic vesicle 2-related protein-like [Ostrinia furnacalis]|uniref:synaptic vesicle 2-related protein-like n=1 Tax=Ostrinia furnacalis TaxID=93504 RepID=UPI00103CC171|nr:synaptic vesicle 2-related protein-like [Ostrinia furnacalis]
MSSNDRDENSTLQYSDGRIPFEEAINKAGFGLYSYLLVALTGFLIIAFAAIAYSTTLIIPTSACELGTTSGQQGLLAAAPIVGSLLGSPVWGYIGDTRGRRNTIIISLLCGFVFNAIASLSVNWIMLLILQFVATSLASGQYSLSMSMLSESVPMAKRNLVVMLVTSIFILAQGIMAVIAIPVIPLSYSYYIEGLGIYWNSWRTLMLLFSAPSAISAFFLLFISESPKFAYSKGNEEEALAILRRIHRINNRFSKNKEELQVKGLLMEERPENDKPKSAKEQFAPLVRAPLLKYMIIMTLLFVFQQIGSLIVWFPTIANQFMETIENDSPMNQTVCDVLRSHGASPPVVDPDVVPCSLNNTAMLIVLAVGAMQSFLSLVLNFFLNTVGRRNMVIIITAVCGLSGVIMNLVPNTIASAALFLVLLMGLVVLGLYTAIAVALFPTNLRVLALGLTLTGARVGTIAFVQILNYLLVNNCEAGFYVFASMFGSSAIVASFLPDDRRLVQKPPPEPKKTEEQTADATQL